MPYVRKIKGHKILRSSVYARLTPLEAAFALHLGEGDPSLGIQRALQDCLTRRTKVRLLLEDQIAKKAQLEAWREEERQEREEQRERAARVEEERRSNLSEAAREEEDQDLAEREAQQELWYPLADFPERAKLSVIPIERRS
jgi:uncharacterized membrane protein YqiK